MIIREEDARTALNNFMSRIGGASSHFFDKVNLSPSFSFLQLIDINREDILYFNKFYSISKKLNSIIAHMCKQEGGKKFTETEFNNYSRNHSDRTVSREFIYDASRDIGDGMLTTSTIAQTIQDGNGFYVVYFTFDSSIIEDCKVLCYDKNNGYYLKVLPRWSTVNPNLYKKQY